MTDGNKTKVIAYIAVVAVVAMLAGLMTYSVMGDKGGKYGHCVGTKIAGKAQIGGPFNLIDENGKAVTDKDVIDKPSLIYFGYTYCPDVCPLDTLRTAEAVTILEKRGRMVKPVFISVDPKRDTPEQLRDFTDNMHPRMLGLTGTPENIKSAAKAYKASYLRREDPDGDPNYYLYDHTTWTYLVDPDEGFITGFNRSLSPEQLADQVQCYIDAK